MTNSIEAKLQAAMNFKDSGRPDIAIRLFQEILDVDAKQPHANFYLGIHAYQTGDIDTAARRLETAARKLKKSPICHQLLGLVYLNSGDLDLAAATLRKAISLDPKNADYHAQLGDVFRTKRKPVMARASYEQALRLNPENGYALIGLGMLEISLGHIEAGQAQLKKAIKTRQLLPTAFHRLAMATKHSEAPEELPEILKTIAANAYPASTDVAELHWAAAKIYDDLDDAAKAEQHRSAARAAHYREEFDLGAYRERIDFMKETFTGGFFEKRAGTGLADETPVFIFGMPRSGTTLVEQIIARHSKADSGGEIDFFRKLQTQLGLKGRPSAALQSRLLSMDEKEYRKYANGYLKCLKDIDAKALRVTDKMPHNYEMVWLMKLLFPKASFIHCLRDPADTCVSLLSHALSPAHNYARTQTSVGTYYRIYAGLMDHWKASVPGKYYEVQYEALVDNQLDESKALVSEAGLEWEDRCLEFYKIERPVMTFSDVQVRRPIFRSSMARWRKGKDQLGDLFQALGPLAPAEVRSGM